MSGSYIAPPAASIGPITTYCYRGRHGVPHHIVRLGRDGGTLHLSTEDASVLAQQLTDSIAEAAEGMHG